MEILNHLSRLGGREEYCRNKLPVIFRGEILRDFYVIKQGAAVAQYKVGRNVSTVTLGPGDFFGERVLLGDVSDVTVRAIVDGTIALAVNAEDVRRSLDAEPALMELMRGRMAARMAALQVRSAPWSLKMN